VKRINELHDGHLGLNGRVVKVRLQHDGGVYDKMDGIGTVFNCRSRRQAEPLTDLRMGVRVTASDSTNDSVSATTSINRKKRKLQKDVPKGRNGYRTKKAKSV